ncbi:17150_t:CDS:2 [Racocetra fulgida]|uniref:17150_t:CDS:1 n=1 Tax=Racocetra fulgida TaxID=60492 RepID=A0A9N9FWF8_9GLOM|nr:17150_t:CDS:2 [Racocetra fulgida]
MARTKRLIAEENNEIEETNQTKRVQKEVIKEGVMEEGIVEEGVVEGGSCGNEQQVRDQEMTTEPFTPNTELRVRDREMTTEPSMPNAELNDSDSNYANEIESDAGKEKSFDKDPDTDTSTMESPGKGSHQLQSKVTVSDLLQMSDSDISDDGYYQRDNEKRTKATKRQRNDDNENDKIVESSKKRNVLERPDILTTAIQMRNAMQTSLDLSTAAVLQTELMVASKNIANKVPIENLITKIFNYELYSNEAVEIICYSKRVLTDFRSKLNKGIASLVNEFKDR